MKTILLVRHAKSNWDNFSLTDAERPLNERGKKNAPEMAARLLQKNIPIDSFLSSPAKRALTTAKFFVEVYARDAGEIIVIPELYLANKAAFTQTIINAPESSASIALFSHNSGITDFANSLTDARIDHMPTCGVFAVKCPIDSWSSFKAGENEFYFFDYPKSY
jgi:phosphohistidine phosphatase